MTLGNFLGRLLRRAPMFSPPVEQPKGLIGVLYDLSAPTDDRAEAASDLWEYDEALSVLIAIASREGESARIVESCGESIWGIWKRTGGFDRAVYLSLPAIAQFEIAGLLDQKPDA